MENVQEEETRPPSDDAEHVSQRAHRTGKEAATAAAAAIAHARAAPSDNMSQLQVRKPHPPQQQLTQHVVSRASLSLVTITTTVLEQLPHLFSTLTDAQWEQVKTQEQHRRDSLNKQNKKKAPPAAAAAAAAAPDDDKSQQDENPFLVRIGRIEAILKGKSTAEDEKTQDDGDEEEEDFVNNNLDQCEGEGEQDEKMATKDTTTDEGNDDNDNERELAAKYHQRSQEAESSKNRQKAHAANVAASTPASVATFSNGNKKKRGPPPPSSSECEDSCNKKHKKAAAQDALQPDRDIATAEEAEDGTTALTVIYNHSATRIAAAADASTWTSRRRRQGKPKTSKKAPPPGSSSESKKAPALANSTSTKERPPSAAWQDYFQQLVQFKAQHGHVEVSENTHKEPHYLLAVWCKRQRWSFMNRVQMAATGEKKYPRQSVMTEYQHSQLKSVGFRFSIAARHAQTSFEDRVDHLSAYKSTHGDCRVPRRYSGYDNLGSWVMYARALYRSNELSADRIATLDALGFEWSVPRSGSIATQTKKKNAATESTVEMIESVVPV